MLGLGGCVSQCTGGNAVTDTVRVKLAFDGSPGRRAQVSLDGSPARRGPISFDGTYGAAFDSFDASPERHGAQVAFDGTVPATPTRSPIASPFKGALRASAPRSPAVAPPAETFSMERLMAEERQRAEREAQRSERVERRRSEEAGQGSWGGCEGASQRSLREGQDEPEAACALAEQRLQEEAQQRQEQMQRMQEARAALAAQDRQEEEARRAEAAQEARRAEECARSAALAAFLREHGFSSAKAPRRKLLRTSYAVHKAAKLGDGRMVEILLQEGADPMLKDWRGKTAMQLAEMRDKDGSHAAVLSILAGGGSPAKRRLGGA